MPTYDYRCKECGHQFEIHQSFADDALTTCPECQGALKKIFSAVGISFKGSGFYKTDSRGSTSATTPSSSASSSDTASTSTSSEKTSSDTGSSTKSADKPASTPSATTSSTKSAPAASS
jgi:putative FmdB family regulatory protein